MGIYETRRANLRWLIDNQYGGVAANLAKDQDPGLSALADLQPEPEES